MEGFSDFWADGRPQSPVVVGDWRSEQGH